MEATVARLALALAALIGCAHHAPAMLYGEPVPAGCAADGTNPSDRCMGWYLDRMKMANELEYDDRELARYVSVVGTKVARAAGDRRTWTFHLLDDGEVQAEGIVATTVYVTRGALSRLRDEAELAALLGHEVGHVVAGHAHESSLALARGIRDSSRDLQAQRDDEIQADQLGMLFMARAGYDPRAVETMLRAIAAGENDDDPDDPHPPLTERLARIQAFASRFSGGERHAREFLAHVAHLAVGTDPRVCAVVDSAIVFSHARLAIDPPAGWVRVDASRGTGKIEFADGTIVQIRVMPAAHANAVPPDPDVAFETYVVHGTAVVIAARGRDAVDAVHRVRASIRATRAHDVGDLEPVVADLAKPRALWPDETSQGWDLGQTWATNDHGVIEQHRLTAKP